MGQAMFKRIQFPCRAAGMWPTVPATQIHPEQKSEEAKDSWQPVQAFPVDGPSFCNMSIQ